MSARTTDLQAQVESVLGALVKAATVELTKLFEIRYGVSPLQVEVGRNEDKEKTETIKTLDDVSTADTKRSIGVQVENDIYAPLEASGPPFVSEENSLRGCGKEVMVQERCRVSSKMLLYEDNSYVDSDLSPVNEQVLSMDVVEVDVPDDFPTDSDAQTDIVFHVSAEAWTEVLTFESTQKHAAKQQPIVIQSDTSNNTSDKKVNFVCPLILKPESPAPKPDSSEKQFQAEPQQSCVSTAKGTAYSPSLSDGAMTPAQVGVWERIHTPDDAKNNLHMRLKLSSADPKLMGQCTVQLVDVLKVSKSGKNLKDNVANHKTDVPLPKGLRRHQGLHTGHRICCFTSCENHIWRLHKDVAHSRDRYVCSICGKDFKRRKVLRRHERFHSGERPYSCSVCSKVFALRKSLRRHVRFHTGERPYICTQCGKGFRLRDNLKAHLRFHTGEKPFSCATCGKMFRIMRNLEKHKVSECQLCVPSFNTIAGL